MTDATSAPTTGEGPDNPWGRYRELLCAPSGLEVRVDPSRIDLSRDDLDKLEPSMARAFALMEELERGAIANPDEGRMVGHYWLRDPDLAPTREITAEIRDTLSRIKKFATGVRSGKIAPPSGGRFENLLVVGIGGSALGPQLVSDALGVTPAVSVNEKEMRIFFLDNTDPDGIDRVLAQLRATPGGLAATLTIVISKSGGTKETRNGMLEAKSAYREDDVEFPPRAVAITGDSSQLDKTAQSEQWRDRFPMWDWVGGRTSELSAVGLLPAALQGIDIDALLEGARKMDQATRVRDCHGNPAALLALIWHCEGKGKGAKDMVILPYKDRLLLLSRYLQQLVMESLGKEKDLDGKVVNQGIVVYGNKGSTDQHAYVQQLREGPKNFFATFLHVLEDRSGSPVEVEPGVTSGDYLLGFLLGTREALGANDRGSLTITVSRIDAATVGKLVALFERAVGFYAALVGINAYHQPGVEAGKRAAAVVLDLQRKVWSDLESNRGVWRTVEVIAASVGEDDIETVFHILEHRAANPQVGGLERREGKSVFDAVYTLPK